MYVLQFHEISMLLHIITLNIVIGSFGLCYDFVVEVCGRSLLNNKSQQGPLPKC